MRNAWTGFSKQYWVCRDAIRLDEYPVPDGRVVALMTGPRNTEEIAYSLNGACPVVGMSAGLEADKRVELAIANVGMIRVISQMSGQVLNVLVVG